MKKLLSIIALAIFSLGTFAQKEEAQALVRSGLSKLSNGDCDNAIVDFQKAIELDPENLDAYLKRAFCLGSKGQHEEAIADYTKVIQLKPNQSFAYTSRGSSKNKLKKFAEGLLDFNKAIELDPENSQAYYNRGESKKGLGDLDGACKDWHLSKKKGNDEAKIVLKNNRCK